VLVVPSDQIQTRPDNEERDPVRPHTKPRPPIEEDDYQPGDEYDWDQSDPRQRCRHGTFIGSHWGPDLLCRFCEDGTTDEEFARLVQAEHLRHVRELATPALVDDLVSALATLHGCRPLTDLDAYIAQFFNDLRAATVTDLEVYLTHC
jgi:hypothetical protein